MRYTKRPVLAERRIVKFERGYVTYRFKDYHKGGIQSFKKLPVLVFMDRLLQHLPETHFRRVRHYGLFSNAKRTGLLRKARRLLAQRKKRRPTPETWVQRRQAAGDRKPLSYPRCGHLMELWCLLFGKPQLIAQLLGIETNQKITRNTLLSRADVSAVAA